MPGPSRDSTWPHASTTTTGFRIADVLAVNAEGKRPDWLAAPSQSLEPTALLE